MRHAAFACFLTFSVCVLAWSFPAAYTLIFVTPIDKTKLFYSPVLGKCIYTEQIRGVDPEAAAKSEGHHSDTVYKDAAGVYYDRLAFEAALPFIYYRNMEIRGLMPVMVEGKSFDRQTIEKARRVLELPATSLAGHRPEARCLPLIESNPGQVALLYPDDRFRATTQGLEFINADTNTPDPGLSELFTIALKTAGFTFPVQHTGGNFTTFKPYEGGIFLVDAKGTLFHLLRKDGAPLVTRVKLPEGVVPRHILVAEAKERQWLGLLLDTSDRIWLLRHDDLALIGLKVTDYKPDVMDFKIIFNPVFATAVFSDEARIHAATFRLPNPTTPGGTVLEPFHTFAMPMSRAGECWQTRIADAAFPFTVRLTAENSAMLRPSLTVSRHYLGNALPCCLLLSLCCFLRMRRRGPLDGWGWAGVAATALAGLYALVPLLLLDERG